MNDRVPSPQATVTVSQSSAKDSRSSLRTRHRTRRCVWPTTIPAPTRQRRKPGFATSKPSRPPLRPGSGARFGVTLPRTARARASGPEHDLRSPHRDSFVCQASTATAIVATTARHRPRLAFAKDRPKSIETAHHRGYRWTRRIQSTSSTTGREFRGEVSSFAWCWNRQVPSTWMLPGCLAANRAAYLEC